MNSTKAGLMAVLLMASTASAGMDASLARVDEKLASSVPEVTAEGELVDLLCYLVDAEAARGPAHAKCAGECMGNGSPIGFLSKGQVYLLVGRDAASLRDQAIKYVGSIIVLVGTPIEAGGIKAILVKKIKALGSVETPPSGGAGSGKHPASSQGGSGGCH